MSYDFNRDLLDHLRYGFDIISAQNKIAEDISAKTIEIISDGDKEVYEKDKFVDLEKMRVNIDTIQADILKVSSRVLLLYQIMISNNIEVDLPDKYKNVLNSIINNDNNSFFFNVNPDGTLEYRNEDFSNMISHVSESRISSIDLKDYYTELKKQYQAYKDSTNANTEEKAEQ